MADRRVRGTGRWLVGLLVFCGLVLDGKACFAALPAGLSEGDPVSALYLQAVGDLLKDHYDAAIQEFSEVIRRHPLPQAFDLRGVAYGAQKQDERAIADFNEAIRLDPKDGFAFLNRANAYARLKQYDRAIPDYGEAISLDPDSIEAIAGRADAYYDTGKTAESVTDLDQLVKLKPDNSAIIAKRGDAHGLLGQYELALADYTGAIRLDPKDSRVFLNRGVTHSNMGNYDLAIADLNQAIILKPDPMMRSPITTGRKAIWRSASSTWHCAMPITRSASSPTMPPRTTNAA
jgi:tetratricopeptide (TPR) repeat protein